MIEPGKILKGIGQMITNSNKELYNERLAICKKCPLYTDSLLGMICSDKKYINNEGKVSYVPKPGYVRGCACIIAAKARGKENHCVVNKW